MVGEAFMFKKSLALILMVAFIFVAFVGCDISFRDPAEKRRESISKFISGSISKDVAGKTGETYQAKWFEFTVHSIERATAYEDYREKPGFRLYFVSISIKSAWEEALPMGLFDFYMDAPDFDEYIWAIAPLDDAMMPEKYDLEPDKTVQYSMVFEVPTSAANLSLCTTESDANGTDGATFSFRI
jgi:hypothetical protein